MASKPDHLERTAAEPRDRSLATVVLERVDEVNDTARVFRLGIPPGSPPIRFLPGQWLDVYVPGVERAGGFTITSTPREARLPHPEAPPDPEPGSPQQQPASPARARGPYLELAVRRSTDSPSAAWLWRAPASALVGAELRVRVGGGFVWPPPGVNVHALRRVVFVAGGMGVNPLVSMLGALAASPPASRGHLDVRFLYSLRDPVAGAGARAARHMLFLERIARALGPDGVRGRLEVFLTGGEAGPAPGSGLGSGGDVITWDGDGGDGTTEASIPFHPRRCTVDDVARAVGDTSAERRFAVVYVCGVPAMTDEFVARLTDGGRDGLGMEPHRVLCEKWW
ncbi:hypothetical protein F4802DRAFT_26774 [Xylaria palmicola]|nr:hypothetical protein F4802DRAFT_26774 [Xylaria palmicola]